MKMVPPWRLNQLLERIETGPICTERDFDLRILYPKLHSLIKEYDLKFDPEEIVPSDDSLADDLWNAAWDLYLDVGTLCLSNHRRILFEESEIKEAMRFSSSEITVGTGRDARRMGKREIEDTRTPHCILSPDITCDEEIFTPYTIAYLQEPLADGVCAPILDTIEGMPIKSGSPMEVKGSIAHAMMFREAARRVGRPGLNLQSVGTAESDAAQIAVSNPEWGARPSDTRFVPSLAELKIDYSLLNKMVHFHQYGGIPGALFGPLYGGYSGGAEGTALVGIAFHIMALMVNQTYWSLYFPIHFRYSYNTSRELLWVLSVTYQALARNTPFISLSGGFTDAGPCTPMVLHEAAAHGLVSTVSGANLWEIATAENKHKNRATPLEARLACEVGYGSVEKRLKREDANELVKGILAKYEDKLGNAPLGKTFQECYDLKKIVPTKEYLDLYEGVKKELGDMGVPSI
ncbi:monomethylamine:corrinoid methyltransferase [archaeon]|nr:monomethylamine:corrinoid methyltransferase [archaeon]